MSNAGPADTWLARAWMLLIASSALYFLADNEADNDLWVHLFSGRRILALGAVPRVDDASYTAAGAAWVDHEWLTQVVFAWLFAHGGGTALWLAKLAVALLTAALLWTLIARHAANWWARGPVMVLALAALSRGYAVRPQIVTALAVAALLVWLDRTPRPSWRTLPAVVAAFTLWSNAHGAVVVGLGILGLYVGQQVVQKREISAIRFVLAATVGACLTPYGADLFAYVVRELSAPHPLSEWQPVQLADPAQRPFLVLLAAWLATLPFARLLRRHWWWALLVAGLAALALRQQRHTPLFALCAAAPLADQADAALAWLAARARFRFSAAATGALAAALAGLATLQLALLGARLAGDGPRLVFEARDYPVGAVRYLASSGTRGNLALPLDWGGYALWHLAPAIAVSLDGRFATVYPPATVEDGFAFFRGDGDPAGARLLDAYPTTLVLAPRGLPTPLDQRPEWHLLYTDETAALYGRDGPPAAAASNAPRGRLPFP
ncbi:MAG: hypothetical protein SF182_04810 [Deltaproteobacteria bacterium]|nr:hypothetical protein [Deltaproteobacteria bacterium]